MKGKLHQPRVGAAFLMPSLWRRYTVDCGTGPSHNAVMRPFVKKILLTVIALVIILPMITAMIGLYFFMRYEDESIDIAGTYYVLRTDMLTGEQCVYPARKYLSSERERLAAEISMGTSLDMCFLDDK